MRSRKLTLVWISGAALAVLVACGGGTPIVPIHDAKSTVAGRVVKGSVVGSMVTAYQLTESFERRRILASATTNEMGAFELELPSYSGPILLAATGGSYREESAGVDVKLDGQELTALLPAFRVGTAVENVAVTPVSTWATALTQYHVTRSGKSLVEASEEAFEHLNAHFGNVDWRSVSPAEVVAQDGGVASLVASLSADATAGLLLAALSESAKVISTKSNLGVATNVTAASLTEALRKDVAADGTFDGREGEVDVWQAKVMLDGHTLRVNLAQALGAFVDSTRNATKLAPADVRPLQNALMSNNDAYLFCKDKTETGPCKSGVDLEPPVLSFVGAPPLYVSGKFLVVSVLAVDAGKGVGRVVMEIDGTILRNAAFNDNAWTAFLQLDKNARDYTIRIWGEDDAVPPNSGRGQPEPYSLTFKVRRDDDSPVFRRAEVPSFFDEQGLEYQLASGEPVFPPKFVYQQTLGEAPAKIEVGRPRVPGGPEQILTKSETRLKCGTDIEGANEDANTPFVQFAVDYNPNTDSPITELRYRLTSDGCPTCEPKQGVLGPIKKTDGQARVFFLLPICVDTLGGHHGGLAYELTVVDAAGNSAQGSLSTRLAITGPPIVWQEDTAYHTLNDSKSIFNYERAGALYHELFNPSNTTLAGEVRLARFIVKNPASAPLVLELPTVAQSQWALVETWANTFSLRGSGQYTLDGFAFNSRNRWNTHPEAFSAVNERCAPEDRFAPCGEGQRRLVTHFVGSGQQYQCDVSPTSGLQRPAVVIGNSTLKYQVYRRSGGVEGPAAAVANGYLVPGAGDVPGELIVYLVGQLSRPASADRLNTATAGGARYEYHRADVWRFSGQSLNCSPTGVVDQYDAELWTRRLEAAQANLGANIDRTTRVAVQKNGAFDASPHQRKLRFLSLLRTLDL